MTLETIAQHDSEALPAVPEGRRRHRRKLPVPVIVAAAYLLLIAFALMVPGLLGAGDPTASRPEAALRPPGVEAFFGTDQLGRDVYSRVVHGARWSLGIAFAALLIGAITGSVLGLIAGLLPGVVDEILSRLFDLLSAFPGVLLALLIAVLWGRGVIGIAVAIGLSSIPKFARIIRSRTVQVATADYVTNAVLFGYGRLTNVVRHVFPNVVGSIALLAAIDLGTAVLAVSALSFLQMGPLPPTPEWGIMLAESRDVLRVAWWPSVFPGLILALTVIAFVVLGRHAQARYEGRSR